MPDSRSNFCFPRVLSRGSRKADRYRRKFILFFFNLRGRGRTMELAWNRLTRQRRDGGEGEDRRESKRWKAEEKGIRGGGIDRNRSGGRGGAGVNDWTRRRCGVARSTGTNRFIDELSRIKAGPTGRPRAISHANVFPLNFEKLFYHRFRPVLAISVAPKVV